MRNNAEVIISQSGAETLSEIQQQAEMSAQQIEQDVQTAEQEAQNLEMELMEAQLLHERKEEAERKGKEVGEKIGELA